MGQASVLARHPHPHPNPNSTRHPYPTTPPPAPALQTPYAFPILLALLFWGPQDRAHNVGLNAVWDW